MAEKQLTINYQEFSSPDQMSAQDQELVRAALEAQKGSYSPYSQFQVGAALLLANGMVVKGANQENIAYPSGLCAERSAMFWAGANYPDVPFDTLAIAGSDHGVLCESPASPCGSCRQVMAEFCDEDFIVILGRPGAHKEYRLSEVLPFIFTKKEL